MSTSNDHFADGLTLVLPEKLDEGRASVRTAWEHAGGETLTLGRFWEPPELDCAKIRLYGNTSFCHVLAQKLGLELVSPPDDMLIHLDPDALKRSVALKPLASVSSMNFPLFAKPSAPKIFRAAVYDSPAELSKETMGINPTTLVLVSTVVEFVAEARCWVLDRNVLSLIVYEGNASTNDALSFTSSLVSGIQPAETYVLDVGLISGKGWAVIEANPAWGAGINGGDPCSAARCLAKATRRPSRPSGT